jgi:hypothetical protein
MQGLACTYTYTYVHVLCSKETLYHLPLDIIRCVSVDMVLVKVEGVPARQEDELVHIIELCKVHFLPKERVAVLPKEGLVEWVWLGHDGCGRLTLESESL